MAFVLDASVAIAWFAGKQATAYTNRLRLKARRELLRDALPAAGVKLA